MSLSVLAVSPGDLLATHFSRKKRVFCISKTVFKTFSSFSLEFLLLFTVFSISLSTETDPNPPQTPFLHHFITNLQEKVWVFSVSLHFPHFEYVFSCFDECIGVIMILSNVMLIQGFALSW